MELESQELAPPALLQERPRTDCIEGWVWPQDKTLPHQDSIPWPSSQQRVNKPTSSSLPPPHLQELYKFKHLK